MLKFRDDVILMINSQHGIRVRLDILESFMIGPSVQNCAFESLIKVLKGNIYLLGPCAVADSCATR